MGTKLDGFNFNTTYLMNEEMKDKQRIKHIFCIFSPTDYLCGHPEIQHGGATATIIDHSFGFLGAINSRENIATANLTIQYRRPIKKDQLYVFEGQVDKREGRKIYVSGKIK